jgi:hypothetical protein
MGTDETPNEVPAGATGPPRPFWLVWLILFGLVVVLLGGAFLLDARLRPRVGTEPPATTISAVISRPTPMLVPSATASTVGGTPVATSVPTPSTPSVGGIAQLTPGVRFASSPLEQDIEAAYLHYWQVYRDAAATDDVSPLPEVLNGDALQWTIDDFNQWKTQGRGVDVQVKHEYVLRDVTSDHAEVDDQYTDASRWIDLKTGQRLARQGPPQTVTQTFLLERTDGTWKIYSGTRNAPQ